MLGPRWWCSAIGRGDVAERVLAIALTLVGCTGPGETSADEDATADPGDDDSGSESTPACAPVSGLVGLDPSLTMPLHGSVARVELHPPGSLTWDGMPTDGAPLAAWAVEIVGVPPWLFTGCAAAGDFDAVAFIDRDADGLPCGEGDYRGWAAWTVPADGASGLAVRVTATVAQGCAP